MPTAIFNLSPRYYLIETARLIAMKYGIFPLQELH